MAHAPTGGGNERANGGENRAIQGRRGEGVLGKPNPEDAGERRFAGAALAETDQRGTTSGNGRTPYSPEPCDKCRPCACTRHPAVTAHRTTRRPAAAPSSSRGAGARTPPASGPQACGLAGPGP